MASTVVKLIAQTLVEKIVYDMSDTDTFTEQYLSVIEGNNDGKLPKVPETVTPKDIAREVLRQLATAIEQCDESLTYAINRAREEYEYEQENAGK